MEQFDTGMMADHHYSGNIKIELRKGSDAFFKMSSQGSDQADQKEAIFHFRMLRLLCCGCFLCVFFPQVSSFLGGRNVPGISRCALFFRQTGLDILNSDPKQARSLFSPHPLPSPSSICDWEVFVSFALPPGACLPDTCPAWPSFSLISSVSVETCEGHLLISLRESLPARCLCQQLGADSQPSSIHSLLYDPPGKGSVSPQTDRLICMPINHSQIWCPGRQRQLQ